MIEADLDSLGRAVTRLLSQTPVRRSIAQLRKDLQSSPDAFVWASVDCEALRDLLPATIQSAWIFLLRKDVWSGAHLHPNSVQHMVVVEGRGHARVAGKEAPMVRFDTPGRPARDLWQVIARGAAHEFLPEGEDMAVISFHTCPPHELIEIEVGTGHSRNYERKPPSA